MLYRPELQQVLINLVDLGKRKTQVVQANNISLKSFFIETQSKAFAVFALFFASKCRNFSVREEKKLYKSC